MNLKIGAVILLLQGVLFAQEGSSPGAYVYVAPLVKHAPSEKVFTTFALTNTTKWWFNPVLRLVDQDGRIAGSVAPLLKGFGTWQETTVSLLDRPFQGSIWIVSSQPIVGFCFIHQMNADGTLILVASGKLELASATVETLAQAPAEFP